jgi:hypothetical protein
VQLWIGQAVYKVGNPAQPAPWPDPAELSRHLTLDTELPEINGEILFSATDVGADPIGAITRLTADHWQRPALPPVLPRHAHGPAPLPPLASAARTPDGGIRIEVRSRGNHVPALYALRQHTTGDDGLVAVLPGARDTQWTVPAAPEGAAYTVTSVDRANRESSPITVRFPRG